MIRILLVDDHQMWRETLRAGLAGVPDFAVSDAGSGFDAIERAGEHPGPHVILMDIEMPGLSGFAAARKIRQQRPEIRIVFLTMHEIDDYIIEAVQIEVTGYISKNSTLDELTAAIRSAHAGVACYSPRISHKIVERARACVKGEEPTPGPALPPRQAEVLKLIAEGYTVKQIGQLLGISESTAGAHKLRLMKTLNLHTTAGLVQYAARKGIIHVQEDNEQ